jgi:hypothetical protein
MADPVVMDPPIADPPPAEPVAMIGTDGKFTEKWREALPEDIRGEPSLQSFKDVQGLAKSLVNAQRMVGKNKVAIPGETSSAGEWEEFWKAAGRPETAADYQFKRPAEVPEEHWNAKLADEAQALFHKIGLSKKQAAALLQFNVNNLLTDIRTREAEATAAMQGLTDGLHKEWGAAYDEKVHLGNVAIEQGTGGEGEFKDRVVERFGNDPDFIRFAANLGAKFAEHGVKAAPTATPADIDMKISDLMNTDAYLKAGHPGHKAAVEQVHRLFKSKHPQGQA